MSAQDWPVNLHFSETQGAVFHEPVDTCAVFECREGRWYAEAYAAALVELADAVPYHIGNLSTAEAKRIIAILDRLAAAKAVK